MREKSKRTIATLYGSAMLLSGIITLFIVGSIVVASISSRKLLEYKEHVKTSYQSGQREIIKVGQVENSIWAKWPYWLMAAIAALIGLLSFAAFFILFFVFFCRIYEKVFS